jgi:hypothetical protein
MHGGAPWVLHGHGGVAGIDADFGELGSFFFFFSLISDLLCFNPQPLSRFLPPLL